MTFSTTMRASLCLALMGGLSLAGCGGDSTPTDMGGTDLGMTTDGGMTDSGGGPDSGSTVCPAMAPTPANQMGPCCYRASNGTRLDAPNFRLAALKLTAPSGTLSSPLIGTLLQQGFDQETFNWIIQLSGVPATGAGSLMVKTGYGERVDATGHFHFTSGAAPTPGDTHRWDPVMTTGMVDATDNVTTMPYPGVITIPSFDSMMPSHPLLIEFPIYNLELTSMHMSEMRSCVGTRGASRWDTTMGGTISAYVRVEDAKVLPLNYATLTTTLCGVIAGSLSDPHYCDDPTATPPGTPQAMWTTKPDSMCTGVTCTANTTGMTDVCDPATTCNAWHLLGQFDAQGVDVDP